MKVSTINQIVEAILDQPGDTADLHMVANEAAIYLKTALICEDRGIDKAMEYFTGTHSGEEYKEWCAGTFDPVVINLCKNCHCMTHTLDNGRCGKCRRKKALYDPMSKDNGGRETKDGN